MQDLKEWFSQRLIWQQNAVKMLLESGSLTDQDIDSLVEMCLKESCDLLKAEGYVFPDNAFGTDNAGTLHLSSIGNVQGINKLSPKKPLLFGELNLSVVYGLNASGKSGYVRILKHLCGAKEHGQLLPNVFDDSGTKQSCQIKYRKDGSSCVHEWFEDEGVIGDLSNVDIFDTSCGSIYVSDENEVTYEPPLLSFFSDLIDVFVRVSTALAGKEVKLVSAKPSMPFEHYTTPASTWYNGLKATTSNKAIEKECTWTDADKQNLQALEERLAQTSPIEKAKKLRSQKKHLDDIVKLVEIFSTSLSDEKCQEILNSKKTAQLKRSAATTSAETLFTDAPLGGVGSDVWVELWEKARLYSEGQAYTGQNFPVVDEGARCVLCQQELSTEAKGRLTSFEEFVKGELQKAADQAEDELRELNDNIDAPPAEASLTAQIDASGLSTEDDLPILTTFFQSLSSRKSKLAESSELSKLGEMPSCTVWLANTKSLSESYETQAKQYDSDALKDNRKELESEKKELNAKKWLSEQKEAISQEVERLKTISLIQNAKKTVATTGLSKKKGEIADTLITDAFVARFNDELKRLRGRKIHVELLKKRVDHGRVLHCIRLKGIEGCAPRDVLSEGEYRIVSLAAFFADVASKEHAAPFVFDDPISSLDQDFEEAVVKRLVDLSKNRQVIVFTHRLSLLGLIQEYADKEKISPHVSSISQEPWGAGEPGDIPLWAAKPKKALNILLDQRLPKAKKVYEEEGSVAYEIEAQSICSEFRKLLEKTVEYELLADVVKRHRRDIQTKNKIELLAKIKSEDCKFIDDLMTQYSKYEHSQSSETLVELPEPDELKKDIETLKSWREEFLKRAVL